MELSQQNKSVQSYKYWYLAFLLFNMFFKMGLEGNTKSKVILIFLLKNKILTFCIIFSSDKTNVSLTITVSTGLEKK